MQIPYELSKLFMNHLKSIATPFHIVTNTNKNIFFYFFIDLWPVNLFFHRRTDNTRVVIYYRSRNHAVYHVV